MQPSPVTARMGSSARTEPVAIRRLWWALHRPREWQRRSRPSTVHVSGWVRRVSGRSGLTSPCGTNGGDGRGTSRAPRPGAHMTVRRRTLGARHHETGRRVGDRRAGGRACSACRTDHGRRASVRNPPPCTTGPPRRPLASSNVCSMTVRGWRTGDQVAAPHPVDSEWMLVNVRRWRDVRRRVVRRRGAGSRDGCGR